MAFPSLAAYQILFALCAIAAGLGAVIALLVPYPPGYSPSLNTLDMEPEWHSSEPGTDARQGTAVSSSDAA